MRDNLLTQEELEEAGREFAANLKKGDVIYLFGDLGVGKSTFVRSIIRYFLGEQEPVPSPTFTLLQTYEHAPIPIWHYDLYRLSAPEEVLELGVEEAFQRGITFVEWPNLLNLIYPEKACYSVTLSLCNDPNKRSFRLRNPHESVS